MEILLFILSIVLVESITELLTKSEIFVPIREFFFNRRQGKVFNFIYRLLDCGYCTSVWTGWFVALIFFIGLDVEIISVWIDWFFGGLILHRLSNVLHHIIDRIDRYKNIDLQGQG